MRGVEEELVQRLKDAAGRNNRSLDQYVLELLRRHTGIDIQKKFTKTHSDLDYLSGSWSEDEFDAIQKKIGAENPIDEAL